MLTSVMAYVLFEVIQMLYLSSATLRFTKVVQADFRDVARAHQEFMNTERKHSRLLVGFWFLVLVITILPGFAAALVLAGSFVHRLFFGLENGQGDYQKHGFE
jgi:cobalamin synthase